MSSFSFRGSFEILRGLSTRKINSRNLTIYRTSVHNSYLESVEQLQTRNLCNWCRKNHCETIWKIPASSRTISSRTYFTKNRINPFLVENCVKLQQKYRVVSSAVGAKKVPLAKSIPPRRPKKKHVESVDEGLHHKNVVAYAVGEELNLESLRLMITADNVYSVVKLPLDVTDALMVRANFKPNGMSREAFFFSDGGIACWHMSETERLNMWQLGRKFAVNPYDTKLISKENESVAVSYDSLSTTLVGDTVHLKAVPITEDKDSNTELKLHKYTFSNALAQSVNLSICEAKLQDFIDQLEPETQKLRHGVKSKLNKKDINMRLGEVFLLRHEINLESGFLDTPDIYWEREELEVLYRQMISYLSMPKRVKVLNERLNYCSEILQLFGGQLNDQHHIRLEWIIIILILIEVIFECVHYAEKYGLVTTGGTHTDQQLIQGHDKNTSAGQQ